jgi:hypothetical protein
MLHEDVPADVTAEDLQRRYERGVAAVVEAVGVAEAASETGVETERLEALLDGEDAELTVEEAAALLALSAEHPEADDIVLEVRDELMLGMSSAVMDVDALASSLPGDLGPREIQQKIEGRQPMTLAEYARIRHRVAAENPY